MPDDDNLNLVNLWLAGVYKGSAAVVAPMLAEEVRRLRAVLGQIASYEAEARRICVMPVPSTLALDMAWIAKMAITPSGSAVGGTEGHRDEGSGYAH